MEIPVLAIVASILSLAWAGYLIVRVLSKNDGSEAMTKIATAIQEGAMAYLNRQYKTLAIFTILVFLVLGFAIPEHGMLVAMGF